MRWVWGPFTHKRRLILYIFDNFGKSKYEMKTQTISEHAIGYVLCLINLNPFLNNVFPE